MSIDYDRPFPVLRGDWIEGRDGDARIGKVVAVHWDKDYRDGSQQCLVDVALYSRDGDRIGRVSPRMGGPKGYEPCLDYADWKRIEKPDFPVTLKWIDCKDENGKPYRYAAYATGAACLPDRLVNPEKKPPRLSNRRLKLVSDYDPELEVRSRRMAAQELRDINKKSPSEALIERALQLEGEAAAIAKENKLEI